MRVPVVMVVISSKRICHIGFFDLGKKLFHVQYVLKVVPLIQCHVLRHYFTTKGFYIHEFPCEFYDAIKCDFGKEISNIHCILEVSSPCEFSDVLCDVTSGEKIFYMHCIQQGFPLYKYDCSSVLNFG